MRHSRKKKIQILYWIAGALALTAGLLLFFLFVPPVSKGTVTEAPGVKEGLEPGDSASGSQGNAGEGSASSGDGVDASGSSGDGEDTSGSSGDGDSASGSSGDGVDASGSSGNGEDASGSPGNGVDASGSPGDGEDASGSSGNGGNASGSQENGDDASSSSGNGEDTFGSQTEGVSAFSMVFMGDVYYNDRREANYRNEGVRGLLGESLLALIEGADLAVLNNECALSEGGMAEADKEYTYRMKPDLAASYVEMGIDLVTLANNHALDFGTEALSDTFRTLDSYGIGYIGAGEDYERAKQPAVYELGGRTVAVLAASRVIPVVEWNIVNRAPGMFCTYDSTALEEEIRSCKEAYDYVIVYVHWGVMETEQPQAYQRDMAYRYINAGADLVMGTHPHVVQSIEFYKGKPIYYSLGNFLYLNTIQRTMLLSAEIDEAGELHTRIYPCYAENGTTKLMPEGDGDEFYRYMERISYSVIIDNEGYVKESEDGRTE